MIEIYGKDGCGFCVKAVDLCKKMGVKYTYYNMSVEKDKKDEMAQRIGETPRTVPQVFINGYFNEGGYTGLDEHFKALNTDDLSI